MQLGKVMNFHGGIGSLAPACGTRAFGFLAVDYVGAEPEREPQPGERIVYGRRTCGPEHKPVGWWTFATLPTGQIRSRPPVLPRPA